MWKMAEHFAADRYDLTNYKSEINGLNFPESASNFYA